MWAITSAYLLLIVSQKTICDGNETNDEEADPWIHHQLSQNFLSCSSVSYPSQGCLKQISMTTVVIQCSLVHLNKYPPKFHSRFCSVEDPINKKYPPVKCNQKCWFKICVLSHLLGHLCAVRFFLEQTEFERLPQSNLKFLSVLCHGMWSVVLDPKSQICVWNHCHSGIILVSSCPGHYWCSKYWHMASTLISALVLTSATIG